MKTKLVTSLVLVLMVSFAFAQERFWLKQSKVSEVIAFEKSIDPKVEFFSINESLSNDYYPLADKYKVANPLIVERKPFHYLPINAEYYYTPVDSILRLVSYDWEKNRYGNFFDKQKMWKEEAVKIDVYGGEYERIKNDLLTQLGTPVTADPAIKKVSYDGTKYLSRETLWDTEIYHAELDLIFATTTYRIRLTFYWKK